MFLASHTVAMVTYFVTKMITHSPKIGQFCDILMIASSDSVFIMNHQSAGNEFEPPY